MNLSLVVPRMQSGHEFESSALLFGWWLVSNLYKKKVCSMHGSHIHPPILMPNWLKTCCHPINQRSNDCLRQNVRVATMWPLLIVMKNLSEVANVKNISYFTWMSLFLYYPKKPISQIPLSRDNTCQDSTPTRRRGTWSSTRRTNHLSSCSSWFFCSSNIETLRIYQALQSGCSYWLW